jgi:protocatechuate 3,4-dioxygenase beta subunit
MFRNKQPRGWVHQIASVILAAVCIAALTACGGGGGGSSSSCTVIDPSRDPNLPGCSTSTPVTGSPSLTLQMLDPGGIATNVVAVDRPATLLVTVKTAANALAANTLVSFSTTDRSAAFFPAAATALTDSAGVARITLPVGTVSGAFTVTASATLDSKTATASVNYVINLPPAPSNGLTLVLNDQNGAPTTNVTPAKPGSLAATVRDSAGAVVANTVVTFTTTDRSTVLVPAVGTALSNAEGVAQVALPAGTQAGGFTATASATVGGKATTASTSYLVTLPPGPTVPVPTLTLALTTAGGASTNDIAPDRPGTLLAVVKDSAGAPVQNALVTFVTNDKSGSLTPITGSVLTNASGQAVAILNAGATTSGYTVSASSTVGAAAVGAALNYAVTLPTLTLGTPVVNPTTLAAGGTASLAVTVLSGGVPYSPAQQVSFSSPCVTNGKARIGSPVTTVNGVASTSYTDLGCGGIDQITASTTYNGIVSTSTANLTVQLATAGQLVFVSALPQNIALKGTGGAGRQESATVTFKIMDRSGNPVSGQSVNFALDTSVGGLTLNPASATSGANGLVTTTVASGTVNTPVRVTATLQGTALSSLSDQLVVSTGVAEQNSFSLSAVIRNVEGGQYNGCPAPMGTIVTARLADHFHNPAPDGTAVSFTAEGGSIDASCLTGLTLTTLTDGTVITQKGTPGECTVRYCAGNPRPADGRITVLAYALGEESFVDSNGNNRYDAGEPFTDLGEPFRNDRAVTDVNANGGDDIWAAGNGARVAGEQYIDSNGGGSWNATGNGLYNGVLQTVPNISNVNTVHVRQSMVMVLSNSAAAISLLEQSPVTGLALSRCTSGTTFVNDNRTFHFAIRDSNPTVFANNRMAAHPGDPLWLFDRPGNPLPAGTVITFSTTNGVLGGTATYTVPNTAAVDSSAWVYSVQLASDASQFPDTLRCSNAVNSGALTVTVTTPNGVSTMASFPVTD